MLWHVLAYKWRLSRNSGCRLTGIVELVPASAVSSVRSRGAWVRGSLLAGRRSGRLIPPNRRAAAGEPRGVLLEAKRGVDAVYQGLPGFVGQVLGAHAKAVFRGHGRDSRPRTPGSHGPRRTTGRRSGPARTGSRPRPRWPARAVTRSRRRPVPPLRQRPAPARCGSRCPGPSGVSPRLGRRPGPPRTRRPPCCLPRAIRDRRAQPGPAPERLPGRHPVGLAVVPARNLIPPPGQDVRGVESVHGPGRDRLELAAVPRAAESLPDPLLTGGTPGFSSAQGPRREGAW